MADGDFIVVAFDGDCLMCSGGIRFLAERDRRNRLRFVKLQSPLGRDMERRSGVSGLSTMVVDPGTGGPILTKSSGVLLVLRELGGRWGLLARLAGLVPRGLRDAAYDFIAARRHRLTGGRQSCGLPSEAVRERLLDGERV